MRFTLRDLRSLIQETLLLESPWDANINGVNSQDLIDRAMHASPTLGTKLKVFLRRLFKNEFENQVDMNSMKDDLKRYMKNAFQKDADYGNKFYVDFKKLVDGAMAQSSKRFNTDDWKQKTNGMLPQNKMKQTAKQSYDDTPEITVH